MNAEAVYVTGTGLLCSLPENEIDAWTALDTFSTTQSTVNTTAYAPYFYHPLTHCSYDQYISGNDKRMMGQSMLAAVHSVGKALDNAGLRNNFDALAETEIIVSFCSGHRDFATDKSVVNKFNETNKSLNELLMEEVRPVSSLTEFPNLLAANIAINYKITGKSITLMDQGFGGGQTLLLAYQRLMKGYAKRIIVVSSSSFHYIPEIVISYAMENFLLKEKFLPIWQREQGGICFGGGAGCIILEIGSAMHERGATPYAKINEVLINYTPQENFTRQQPIFSQNIMPILSMTSGEAGLIKNECSLYATLFKEKVSLEIRSLTTVLGALLENAIPIGTIIATYCLLHKRLFSPLTKNCDVEKEVSRNNLSQIIVHNLGNNNKHALIRLQAIS